MRLLKNTEMPQIFGYFFNLCDNKSPKKRMYNNILM